MESTVGAKVITLEYTFEAAERIENKRNNRRL